MTAQRPRLYHHGTGDLHMRLALNGRLAKDDFGFSLDVAGIAPVDLHFRFTELERVLEKAERTMPENLWGLPWLDQVKGVVRELKSVSDERKREALATTALYLAHTWPAKSLLSCSASQKMIERELQQYLEIGRVYLFMMIDPQGRVEVDLFDQGWFAGDDWILDLTVDEVERVRPQTSGKIDTLGTRAGIRELILMEKIVDTGILRKTRSGRFGAVFAIRQ